MKRELPSSKRNPDYVDGAPVPKISPLDPALFAVIKHLIKHGAEARLRTYPRKLAMEVVQELELQGLLKPDRGRRDLSA